MLAWEAVEGGAGGELDDDDDATAGPITYSYGTMSEFE
jgi:hypothetical protein